MRIRNEPVERTGSFFCVFARDIYGAGGGNRTLMSLRSGDFESICEG
jgi:hypothetical protein